MKFSPTLCCAILLTMVLGTRVFGDLFVQSPASAQAGVPVSLEYLSSHTIPPDGSFQKVVVTVEGVVVAEAIDPSGSIWVTFLNPGSILFEVRAYGVDGEVLDRLERSIAVFGIAMIEPVDQTLVGLGSQLYLGASAIFDDRWVERVEFQARRVGESEYSSIPGSRDATVPYAYLYSPPSSGLWEIRARALHPGGGSTDSLPITLQVSASDSREPSSATILDPAPGSSVQAGVKQWVNVDVSSRSGVVRGVQLFVDGERIQSTEGLDVTFPFLFEWTPQRPGPYTLVAIVIDNRGMRWASSPVEVVASDDRPHATLLLPQDGATYPAGTQVPLMALAVGQGGSRERVGELEFLVNGNGIPGATNAQLGGDPAPFTGIWTPTFPGSYVLQVRVVDGVTGARYQSPSLRVVITEASVPAAAVVAPVQGAFVEAGERLQLRAMAATQQGLVESVAFFINHVHVGDGIANAGLFELDYRFEAAGSYHIVARAITTHGQLASSTPVGITVMASHGQRPLVQLEQPQQGEQYRTGESIQLVARATDPDGSVAQVQFFVNRKPLGEPVISYPFVIDTYTFGSAGRYRFSAVATDNRGNLSELAEVEVGVEDPEWVRPSILIQHPVDQAVFEVGDTLYIEAQAKDLDGVVEEVRFEINGQQHGEADRTYPFQSEFFTIETPGVYRITATAKDAQGYLSMPATIVVFAVPESAVQGPRFNPLSKDRDFLTQVYLDLFLRGPTDAELNRFLEQLEFGAIRKAAVVKELADTSEFKNLRHFQNAYHTIFGEWPSHLEFAEVLREQGDGAQSEASGRVVQAGSTFDSAHLLAAEGELLSGALNEVGERAYYSFRLQQDTLVTVFSSGPFDTVGTLWNGNRERIERDDDSGTFFNFAIQRALPAGTYYVSVSGWGGMTGSYSLYFKVGEQLTLPQDSAVSHSDLSEFIGDIYESDTYERRFGPLPSMALDANRRSHFQQLFQHRFEREPSPQQMLQGSNRIRDAADTAAFTSGFVRNDRVGTNDYIYNLPDVRSRDDAAFLIRALLKQRPDAQTIEPLLELEFEQKVESILNSHAYRERFLLEQEVASLLSTYSLGAGMDGIEGAQFPSRMIVEDGDAVPIENPFHHLPTNDAGWKYVEWLGWISDAHYPRLFHSQLGWIQVNPLHPDELWVWHERLDWSYFAAGVFPTVYRYSDQRWVRLIPGEYPGNFRVVPIDPMD